MKDSPTLADGMIRRLTHRSYRQGLDKGGWLMRHLLESRKFVLDREMSAFTADLAYAALGQYRHPGRDNAFMESLRVGARAPHKITWIEFDLPARMRRAIDEYGVRGLTPEPGLVPDTCAWLVVQHDVHDDCFMAIEHTSHAYVGDEDGKPSIVPMNPLAKLMAEPSPHMICYTWSVSDRPISDAWKGSYNFSPSALLSGIETYLTDKVGLGVAPFVDPSLLRIKFDDRTLTRWLEQSASDLRYLWAFLATINDVPTTVSEVRPSKGYVARGRYRKFVEHKVIRLTVPQKISKKVLAQRLASIARRRAHQVRGHWRLYVKDLLCDHDWRPDEDARHLRCSSCKSWKTWIAEHQRGDASVGIVTHDYEVARGR